MTYGHIRGFELCSTKRAATLRSTLGTMAQGVFSNLKSLHGSSAKPKLNVEYQYYCEEGCKRQAHG
jgi:hypothetical protein